MENSARSANWVTLAWAAAAALAGCGLEDQDAATGEIAVALAPLVIASGGSGYALDCKNAGVPLPPPWGGPSQTTNWKATGTPTNLISDNWAVGKSHVYVNQSSLGVCAIAAHDSQNAGDPKGVFDVICQGTNGKACFWEGVQSPVPPAAAVTLADPTKSTTFVQSGTELGPLGTCTRCHVGENVFITHFKTGHPVSGIGITNWKPPAWYEPIVTSDVLPNLGPDPMSGYPAGTQGAGNCKSCHTAGGSGGRFPRIAASQLESTSPNPILVGSYCDILAVVTNRPGSAGGMPPSLSCTPGVDCAKQKDPFVQAMLETCRGVAVSRANSPVAFEAFSQTTPYMGAWDHAMADFVTSSGAHKILLLDNFWNGATPAGFSGWSQSDYTSLLNTDFRTTMWLKGDQNLNSGSNLTIAATDPWGTIWEKLVASGPRRNVTVNSPQPAVGSPYAFKRHDGYDVIVFRGADSWIYEAYWNTGNSTWYTNRLPGQGEFPAMGDPIGYVRSTSASSVVYKCTAGICELRLVSTGWIGRSIATTKYIKPYVITPHNNWNRGDRMIYYAGENGIHGVTDDSDANFGPTSDKLLIPDNNVVSAPIPYTNENGYTSVVYINDAGGTYASSLVQLTKTPNGLWSAQNLYIAQKSVETLAGDPAAYVATSPWLNTILFRNAAGKLYQVQRDPTTTSAYKTTSFMPN